MKAGLKFNKNRIAFYLFFFATFVNIRYIPNYNVFKNICLLLVATYLLVNSRALFKNKYRRINASVILFIVIIIFSMIVNFKTAKQHLNEMIIFCAAVIELFLCIEVAIEKNIVDMALQCIRRMLFIVVCINDFLIFTAGMEINSQSVYFIGDKFYVLYAHLILAALFLTEAIRKKDSIFKQNIILIIGMAWSLIIGVKIQSGSALVCVGLFTLFVLIQRFEWKWTFSSNLLIVLLIASTLFLVTYSMILNIPFVAYFITKILGKTLMLSRRVTIYLNIPEVLKNHLLNGYGFGTSYEVWINKLGYGNAQNAVLDWICQCGVFIIVPIYMLVRNSIPQKANTDLNTMRKEGPLVAAVCMLCVYAAVEITVNIQFIACLALIFGVIMDRNQADNKEKTTLNGKISCKKRRL